jgi:phosphoribosylanthranilate isomerase
VKIHTKICCISSLEEAQAAIFAGADALGLVADMPSGPGVIDNELARTIAAMVPPPISTFLLTQRVRARDIADHVEHVGPGTVQVVSHIEPGEYPLLVKLLPAATRRVQVIHVEDETALDLIAAYAPFVHAFLLDSGRPNAPVPELGGTGRTHDWRVSARFVELSPRPVFLAGGLSAANVGEAIRTVRPYGLDLCSGVRHNGDLSNEKLNAFFSAVNNAL